MKKYLVFILLILLSCQKDEIIVEPIPQYAFIFEAENIVLDGQDIYFEATINEPHQLIILQDNSVITKELFNTEIGLNKRKIFTKTLTGTTVFTYSNTQIGMVKDLIINADGNSFTLPTGTKIIAGTPTTGINFVQVVVTAAGEYWTSISQEQ